MRTLGLALILLTLVGCGKAVDKRSVDATLASYVEAFESAWGHRINFPVRFATIDQQYAGWCIVYGGGDRVIEISNHWWQYMGDGGKEETVFHELGHCALNLDHNETLDAQNRPISIMYPVVFGDYWYYSANRNAYLAQLFSSKAVARGVASLTSTVSDFRHVD